MATNAPVNGERKKTGKKEQTTLRFDLGLVSSSEEGFSEYSYVQLVRDAKKHKADTSSALSDGPSMDDSSDHLASIAQMFEEKYAPKPSKKRKRMIHDSDYIDRGYGYDLNDPFVDDSEFYEDFVPDHVDTKYGGFYINTGELEFKKAEDMDEVDFVVRKKPRIKKQPSHQTPQAILASQKLKKAKQHAALQKAPSTSKKLFPSSGQPPIKAPPTKKPRKKVKTDTPKPVDGTAVVAMTMTAEGLTAPSGQVGMASSAAVGVKVEEDKPPPVLPDNLPQTVLDVVNALTERVATDRASGKVTHKQRDGYSETLLHVESACKCVTHKRRNAVFEYLAHHLGVAKATLTKRMKTLAKKKEDNALEGPLLKLKQAIELSMPRQQALYEEELTKARTESASSADKSSEVDEDTMKAEDVFDETSQLPGGQISSAPSTDSSAPGGQNSSSQLPGGQSGEGATPKQKRLPRKKYRWSENEEVKALLFEVVKVKVQSEESCSRLNREKPDDVINQFLEEKVRPLWPKGWMQKSILYKITESVHKSYTSPTGKRAVPVFKKVVVKKESGPLGSPQTLKKIVVKKESGPHSSPQALKKLPPQSVPPVSFTSTSGSTSVSSRLLGVVQGILTTSPSLTVTGHSTAIAPTTITSQSVIAGSGGLKIATSKSPQTVILKTIGQGGANTQTIKGKTIRQVVSAAKAPQSGGVTKKPISVHTISSLMKGVAQNPSPRAVLLPTSGQTLVSTKALHGIMQGTFGPSVALTRTTAPQTVRKSIPKTTASPPRVQAPNTHGIIGGLQQSGLLSAGAKLSSQPAKVTAQLQPGPKLSLARPKSASSTGNQSSFSQVPRTNVSPQKATQVPGWHPQMSSGSPTTIARLLLSTIQKQAQSAMAAVALESSNQGSLGTIPQVPHQVSSTATMAVTSSVSSPQICVPKETTTQKSNIDSLPPTVISSQLSGGRLDNLITKLHQKTPPQVPGVVLTNSPINMEHNTTSSPILFASPNNSVAVSSTEQIFEEHSYQKSPEIGTKSLAGVSGTGTGLYGIGTGTFGAGAHTQVVHKGGNGTNTPSGRQ